MPDHDVAPGALLTRTLLSSAVLSACVDAVRGLDVWIGAGAVAQTVWNAAHGFSDGFGIHDLDIVHFDPDASPASEDALLREIIGRLPNCPWRPDVKNQAKVHEWYPARFGHGIRPYTSLRDAVASWPTTATAVAIRAGPGGLECLSPLGLDDLLRLVVRPNRVQAPRAVFEAKAARWSALWPRLTVVPWADGVGEPRARWA